MDKTEHSTRLINSSWPTQGSREPIDGSNSAAFPSHDQKLMRPGPWLSPNSGVKAGVVCGERVSLASTCLETDPRSGLVPWSEAEATLDGRRGGI